MDDNEPKKFSNEEKIKLFAVFAFLLAILLYSVFSGNHFSEKRNEDMTEININSIFEPIKDNYTLIINKKFNNDEETIEYITDGTLKLYNKEEEQNGYLIYNGKTYYVVSKGYKLKEVKNKPDFIDDNFANIDFIKIIMKQCKIDNKKNYSYDCVIKARDYIEEYNKYFNSNYVYDGEENIVFSIKHGRIAYNISVDYSLANKIIKNGNNLKYNIKIDKVNDNDYSNLLEVFKDSLK